MCGAIRLIKVQSHKHCIVQSGPKVQLGLRLQRHLFAILYNSISYIVMQTFENVASKKVGLARKKRACVHFLLHNDAFNFNYPGAGPNIDAFRMCNILKFVHSNSLRLSWTKIKDSGITEESDNYRVAKSITTFHWQ